MFLFSKMITVLCIIIGSLTIVSFVVIFTLSTCNAVNILLGSQLYNPDGTASTSSKSVPEWMQFIIVLAQSVSSPTSLQYFTLSNMTMSGLYVVLLVIIIYIDDAMIMVKEHIRVKAKLPSDDVIKHYNDSTYVAAINSSQRA